MTSLHVNHVVGSHVLLCLCAGVLACDSAQPREPFADAGTGRDGSGSRDAGADAGLQAPCAIGQLLDESGAPVAGATIELARVLPEPGHDLYELGESESLRDWGPAVVGPSRTLRSDDAGTFDLPAVDDDDGDAAAGTVLLRIDVSAQGHVARRFYRPWPTSQCGELAWEPLVIDREGFAREALPDLIVDPRWLGNATVATGDDCWDVTPLRDGHGPVATRCLRFAIGIANVGVGDLSVSAPLASMESVQQHLVDASGQEQVVEVSTPFIHHAEHGHVHLDQWAEPRLRRVDASCEDPSQVEACPVVRRGEKISFCLADNGSFDSSLVREGQARFTCGVDPTGKRVQQGIGSGRIDVYPDDIPGQAIDLSGLEAGAYWLEVEVNPGANLREESHDNNVARVRVELGQAACGNGVAEEGEVCDGSDLRGQGCASIAEGYASGELRCTSSCVLDRSACEPGSCPDGDLGQELASPLVRGDASGSESLRSPRRCDPAGGSSFADGPEVSYRWTAPWSGLFLFDTVGSDYDTVLYALRGGCGGAELKCRDDSREGSTPIEVSRLSLELEEGESVILVLDSKGSAGNYVLNVSPGGCGNGVAEGHEACDGDDLAGRDCRSVGFAAGTLKCAAGCEIDTSACELAVCGDGVAQPLAGPISNGEQCDGADLMGAQCEHFDEFLGGELVCTDGCRLDFSGCTRSQ